ncbi:MAG: rhomboid family intramembrane serine protease [Succinivibrionaceae bacterium]|nr:rhomboid family intramembrane serine protease [Succinivibrionaceae bacterium]
MVEFSLDEDDERTGYPVGILPAEMAPRFVDYLNSRGFNAFSRPGFNGKAKVLVHEESQVPRAKIELLRFGSNPYSRAYSEAAWERGAKVDGQGGPSSWATGLMLRLSARSTVTWVEILCVLCYLWWVVDPGGAVGALSLGAAHDPLGADAYRLVTPCLLHFGLLHIAFNLVMWEALGRPLERAVGALRVLLLALCVGIASNLLQIHFVPAGTFGGLSGVVYGVIGYLGVLSLRGQLPGGANFPRGLLLVSVIFLALGFLIDGIANFCHLGGLLLGALAALTQGRR